MRVRILVVVSICLVLLATAMLSSKVSGADLGPSNSVTKQPIKAPLPDSYLNPSLDELMSKDKSSQLVSPRWSLSNPAYLRYLQHRSAYKEYLRMSRKWDHVRRRPCIRIYPTPGYRRYIMKKKLQRKATTRVE